MRDLAIFLIIMLQIAVLNNLDEVRFNVANPKYSENCYTNLWCSEATKYGEALEIMEQQRKRFIELEEKCYQDVKDKHIWIETDCLAEATKQLEEENDRLTENN